MNRPLSGWIAKWLALCAALAACAPLAAAPPLRDPTRPPAGFGRTGDGGTGATGAPGAITAGRSRDGEWVLQSVLLARERRYAIINGEVLAPGGTVAGAELVAIREGEVMLRAGGVLRTVRLFPDVDMRGLAAPRAQQRKQDAVRPDAAEPRAGTADERTR
ncbi:MAG: hypothetical protein ACT4PQ_10635 [Betaproteobacteria bacterium]